MCLFFLLCFAAFIGYVLPFSQMSYYAALVITNNLSILPIVGLSLVELVWGSFNVSAPTLKRFFSFHFLIPFWVSALTFLHFVFLHFVGSSNTILGSVFSCVFMVFHPLFTIKDMVGVVFVSFLSIYSALYFPHYLLGSMNFQNANPILSPNEIEPDWYFLSF